MNREKTQEGVRRREREREEERAADPIPLQSTTRPHRSNSPFATTLEYSIYFYGSPSWSDIASTVLLSCVSPWTHYPAATRYEHALLLLDKPAQQRSPLRDTSRTTLVRKQTTTIFGDTSTRLTLNKLSIYPESRWCGGGVGCEGDGSSSKREGGKREREKNIFFFFVDKPEVRSFSRREEEFTGPGQACKGYYCVHPVLARAW